MVNKSKCDRHWFETQEQKLVRLLHEVSIPVAPPKEDEPQLDPDKEYSTLVYAAFSKSDDL